jgi:hypothetical protein
MTLAIRITSPEHNNNPALTPGNINIQGFVNGPAGAIRLEAWMILNNGGRLMAPLQILTSPGAAEVAWTVAFNPVPSSSVPYPNNPHAVFVRGSVPALPAAENLATDNIMINVA